MMKMGRYKISKILDTYYSDRSYMLVKIAPLADAFEDDFKEGDIVQISKK